jgi:hypothetical protein
LLQITVAGTVYAKNGYDGTRTIAYKTGTSTMSVDTGSSLLSGFTTIASGTTDSSGETKSGSKTFTLGTTAQYLCIGVGGKCYYSGWVGGRYPGQIAKSMSVKCTSLDTTAPVFTYPTINGWVADSRDVTYTVTDNAQMSSAEAYKSGTSIGGSSTTDDTAKYYVSFTASPSYSYYVKGTDTTGNTGTSNTWYYYNFKIDAYNPKVLQVLFVRTSATSTLVTNGLSPGYGTAWNGSVSCYIQVEDYQSNSNYSSGTIYSSGINKVTYNGTTCSLVTSTTTLPNSTGTSTQSTSTVYTSDSAYGKAWYKIDGITANVEDVKIKVTDNVSKTSGDVLASLYHVDNVAPVVESAIITYDGTTLTTTNADTYFNTSGMLTLSIVDYATTGTLSETRDAVAGLSSITLSGTQLSRTSDTTAGSTTYSISSSFNPTTATYTSGKNGTGVYYMTRTYYAEGTYTLSGVTYYCYRYTIEVPLYYSTAYSFVITDNAGNSTPQFKYNNTTTSVSSYTPNIDQTAPTFSSVSVYGYNDAGTSLGSATVDYIDADYLKFDVWATDLDTDSRNDGSGIVKIEIYNSDMSTLYSSQTYSAYRSSSSASSLYVYMDDYTGTLDDSFYAFADINTCINASFKIVITDSAGNSTTMDPSTSTGSMEINPNGDSLLTVNTYVDNIDPILMVQVDGVSLDASSVNYDGDTTTQVYEFNWTNTSKSVDLVAFFGCSGATVYQYANGVDDGDKTTLASYSSGVVSSTYNKNNNYQTVNCVFNTEGTNYYSFKIVNGASVSQTGQGADANYNIVLKVKVDKTAPTYELLGFGTEITISGKDIAGMKASIVSPLGTTKLTESLLTVANSYYDNSFKAYYYIKDTFGSTVDNPTNTSWLSANSQVTDEGTLTSSAKAISTIKHQYSSSSSNYYTYTTNKYYDNVSNTAYTILIVEMFSLNDIKQMTYGSYNLYDSSTGLYNVTYGSNFIYNITISDAVGNTNTIKSSGSADLSYHVDVLPITASDIVSVKDSLSYNYTGDWTDLDVTYTITKQTTISSVICQYQLVDIDDTTDEEIESLSDDNWVLVGDLGSSTSASFSLDIADSSKCAHVYLKIYKNYCNFADTYPSYDGGDYVCIGYNPIYTIKQDVDDPILTAVYFSRNDSLTDLSSPETDQDFLAYFEAYYSGNDYTFTRISIANTSVWTFEKFYMYVVVTDSRGTGSGSGVKTVTLWNQDNTLCSTLLKVDTASTNNGYSGEEIYRSSLANFGYSSSINSNSVQFKLEDNRNNATSATAISTDTDDELILPRVDTVLPSISLTGATYGTSSTSYISSGKMTGDAITQNLTVNLSYTTGISGAKIYCISDADYFNFDYNGGEDDPWGYIADYTGSSIVTTTTPYSLSDSVYLSYFESLTPILTISAGTSVTSSYSYTIYNSTETKARYYFFIVSNINEYYEYDETTTSYLLERPFGYLTGGDVFIDKTPPTINSVTYVSAITGEVIDTTTYTNGDIYAYYNVSDGSSGVDKVCSLFEGTETELIYISSGTYAGCYMLTMTQNMPYQIKAYDNAANSITNAAVTPLIDLADFYITINTKDAENISYNSEAEGNFTNSEYIQVQLNVYYGISGLDEILYRTSDTMTYVSITSLLDKDGANVTVTENSENNYAVVIFNIDVNHTYEFIAYNNIAAVYSTTGAVPSATGIMYIAIDTTTPTLNESDDIYNSIKTVWHSTPQVLTLDVTDNPDGSGIDSVLMSYQIAGVNQDDVIFTYNETTERYETADNFTLSEFVTYSIVITDNAGNVSDTYEIRPALDITKPIWSVVSGEDIITLQNIVDDTTRTTYTAGTWTKYDVELSMMPSYTMSGATVQYSTNNGSSWVDLPSLVWESDITNIEDSAVGTYKDYLISAFTISPLVYSVNCSYIFRIVSDAGLISDTLDVGIIKIDNEKPIYDDATTVEDINPSGWSDIALADFDLVDDTYSTTLPGWTCEGVNINLKTESTLDSGVVLQYSYYNTASSSWSAWTQYTSSEWASTFAYTTNTSGISYKFRYVSGSAMESDEIIVNSIKIDKQTPVFTMAGKTSYTGVTSADGIYQEATKSVFSNGGDYTFGEYTSAKYVVFRINITAMGYSGVTVTFYGTGDDTPVEYASLDYGDSGELYYYIPSTTNLTVTVASNAGIDKTNSANIKIDNAMPELYVAAISGTESTNWDVSDVDSCWFTDTVTITFGVGSYSYDTGLVRSSDTPESGYTIQYKLSSDSGTTWSAWTQVSSKTLHSITTQDILTANIYRFRIKTGSGLINELGSDLVYNGSTVADSSTVDANVLTNHSTALMSHLSSIDYDYLINLDKNDYFYTATQIIQYQESGATESVNSIGTTYAKYTYEKKVNGVWVETTEYEFKHGDQIRVSYDTNYGDDIIDGDDGNYLHRYTAYYAVNDSTTTYGQDIESDAETGSFEFQFTTKDYVINSYFKKELDVAYDDLDVYLQDYRDVDNGTFRSSALVYYANTSLGLALTYTNMNNSEVLTTDENGYIDVNDIAIGGYLISVSFDNDVNTDSFIFSNPSTVLLVKYFTVNGNEPFTISDQYDLERISSTYYDSFIQDGDEFTLGTANTYLASNFIQTEDLTISQFTPIGNTFSGTYDGDGNTIVWNGSLIATGTFGLFTNLSGTVENLAIDVTDIMLVANASNVGVLAGTVDGGTINNVWVNATMTINSSYSSANIGGLVGYASNAQIGRSQANYVDVRMTHDSTVNTNVIGDDSCIGGVIGYASASTYLNNTYSFGGMEIYYTDESVNIGIVIGKLADYITAVNKTNYFSNNYYLSDAAFVNDSLNSSFIGSELSSESIDNSNELSYRDYVTSDLSSSIGSVVVASYSIKESVLNKLYSDFGKTYIYYDDDTETYYYDYKDGLGTYDEMLSISTLAEIEEINGYVNLNYQLTADIDMTLFDGSIATHKIFTGVLEGKNLSGEDSILTNFGGNVSNLEESMFGLFGQFNGTVQNIVFKDVDIDLTYTGTGDLYFGLVAGKSLADANINNIIAIGSIEITASNDEVFAGGLVGMATKGYIHNIFNMSNIKVIAKDLSLGGIAGYSNNTILVNYTDEYAVTTTDAIFSLARVEGEFTGYGSVGAIVGDGSLLYVSSDMSKVFALEDNTYTNGSLTNYIVGSGTTYDEQFTNFASTDMRGTTVSDGDLFTEVFVTSSLYPLSGVSETATSTVGSNTTNPFKISCEEDFKYINNALYANYRIAEDITFTNFETIGEGLYFTGSIDGKTETSGSAEDGTVVALHNVTDSMFYYNSGTISDLSMEVFYDKELASDEDEVFGAIAKYNDGKIRSVIVSGSIEISGGSSITASGFVGVSMAGGYIDNSSLKNSISSISIEISDTGTAYVGGYIGVIQGATTISFAIGQGSIVIEDSSYYVGWLVGRLESSLSIDLSTIQDYTYSITIKEDGVITEQIETIDDDGNPINYCGVG